MAPLLRILFVMLVAYPVAFVWLGLLVRHRERLPMKGPAILAANHNSHLDILALFSLFPMHMIPQVRPVAAADYFLKNSGLAWFSRHLLGILPIARSASSAGPDPLDACHAALERGEIVIIFPEGTRGEPETMGGLKPGIWHLARRFPEVKVTPVFMSGLGRSMPKGGFFPVPLFVDIFIGQPLAFYEDKTEFMRRLTEQFRHLRAKMAPADSNKATEKHDASGS